MCNAVIFLIGSSLQAGATSHGKFPSVTPLSFAEDHLPADLFAGSAFTGLATGSLTHVVPMYLAEISSAKIRGSLVSLQQLAITFGVSETTSTRVTNASDVTKCRFLSVVRGSPLS
jgi:MFS family permease